MARLIRLATTSSYRTNRLDRLVPLARVDSGSGSQTAVESFAEYNKSLMPAALAISTYGRYSTTCGAGHLLRLCHQPHPQISIAISLHLTAFLAIFRDRSGRWHVPPSFTAIRGLGKLAWFGVDRYTAVIRRLVMWMNPVNLRVPPRLWCTKPSIKTPPVWWGVPEAR